MNQFCFWHMQKFPWVNGNILALDFYREKCFFNRQRVRKHLLIFGCMLRVREFKLLLIIIEKVAKFIYCLCLLRSDSSCFIMHCNRSRFNSCPWEHMLFRNILGNIWMLSSLCVWRESVFYYFNYISSCDYIISFSL